MRKLALTLLLLLAPIAARGEGVGRWWTWSLSGGHCAELDPALMRTRVYRVASDGARELSWSLGAWFPAAALSDDGQFLVVPVDASGRVPVDYHPDDALVRIYSHGDLVREVTLAEVVADPRDMIRLASHYWWGRPRGFDASGRYVLDVGDGEVRIDPARGVVP